MSDSSDEIQAQLRTNQCIVRIQCRVRIMLARIRARKAREAKTKAFEDECHTSMQIEAATLLQAMHRRRAAQKRAEDERKNKKILDSEAVLPREGDIHSSGELGAAVTSLSGDGTPKVSLPTTGNNSRKGSHIGGRKVLIMGSPKANAYLGGPAPRSDGSPIVHLQADGSVGIYGSDGAEMDDSMLTEYFFQELHPDSSITKAFAIAAVSFARMPSSSFTPIHEPLMRGNRRATLLEECAIVVLQCWFRRNLAKAAIVQRRNERSASFANEVSQSLQSAAAMSIQAHFRGHHTRRRHSAPTTLREDPDIVENPSPTVPQRTCRSRSMDVSAQPAEITVFDGQQFGTLSDEEKTAVLTAVLRLQCMVRKTRARTRALRAREAKRLAFEEECSNGLEAEAATLIQAMHRRRMEQKRFAERRAQQQHQQHQHNATAAPLSLAGLSTAFSATEDRPPQQLTPSTFAKKKRREVEGRRQAYEAPPVVPRGTGEALSQLFFSTTSTLMDHTVASIDRCLFWGVRLLHSVAIDVATAKSSDATTQQQRLPLLEITRWIQGPLGSVIPMSKRSIGNSISGSGGVPPSTILGAKPKSPRNLPALPKTPEGTSPRISAQDGTIRPKSSA